MVKTYNHTKILDKAKTCKSSVKKNYKLGISTKWSYYICQDIIHFKKEVKKVNFDKAPKPSGKYISRQIKKADYLKLAKEVVRFVNTHKRLPNYLTIGNYKIRPALYTYMFSRILVYLDKNNKYPKSVNVNSKCFKKPVEYKNVVYKYFVEKTGKEFKTIDDLLGWMSGRGYGYYYDDQYSNKEVIDRMINHKGVNCTDSLQFLINMAEEMGYSCKCLHVRCSSGSGHVRGKFKHKKHTEGKWIKRDPASVLNGNGVKSNWCTNNYTLLATNPSWFKENLRR